MDDQLDLLDIGGEGRYPLAWNLNPSPVKTLGSEKGQRIPRLILARANAIPLADDCVQRIVVERTPLTRAALLEIARVLMPGGLIVLRHARLPTFDPHALARQLLPGRTSERLIRIGSRPLQETRFVGGSSWR